MEPLSRTEPDPDCAIPPLPAMVKLKVELDDELNANVPPSVNNVVAGSDPNAAEPLPSARVLPALIVVEPP